MGDGATKTATDGRTSKRMTATGLNKKWWPRNGPPDIAALAAGAVGIALVLLALVLRPAPLSALPAGQTVPAQGPAAAMTGKVRIAPDSIAKLQLFGVRTATSTAAKSRQAAAEEAPPTRLKLELRGLLANEHGAAGSAIIRAAGDTEREFTVGDEVTRGVTIEHIYPDRVIISRGGARESLLLPKDELAPPPQPQTDRDKVRRAPVESRRLSDRDRD